MMSDYEGYFTSIIRQIIRLSKNVGLWRGYFTSLIRQIIRLSNIVGLWRLFTSIIRHFADFPQMSDYGGSTVSIVNKSKQILIISIENMIFEFYTPKSPVAYDFETRVILRPVINTSYLLFHCPVLF